MQSDWNTNDENDLSFVKNRTHYSEYKTENIIPETTVSFGAATKPGYDTGTATGTAIQIFPEYGEEFIVNWNGEKYYLDVVRYLKVGESTYGHGIGQGGMFGGGMNKMPPFLIGFLTEEEAAEAGYTYMVWVNDGSTSATFSVEKIVHEYVHKLSEKYIPDTVARVDSIPTYTLPSICLSDSSTGSLYNLSVRDSELVITAVETV